MDFKKLITNMTVATIISGLTATAAFGADPVVPQPTDETAAASDKAETNYPAPTDFVPVDTPPTATYREAPQYPRLAQRVRLEGTVYVQSLVDTSGEVVKAIVGKTSGAPILDQAALDAAFKYEYKPAMQDGKPVAYWVTYKVAFEIPEDTKTTAEASDSD